MKKTISIVLIVCMLFGLSACGENNVPEIGKSRSPEDVAGNFMLALYTANPEKLIDCVPAFMLRQMAQSYGLSADDTEVLIDVIKSSIGEDDVCECVISSANKDDASSVLNEYVDNLDNYGVTDEDLSKIDEYCMVNVEATVDGENRNNIVFCVKYDGEWCVVDID